MTLSEKVYLKIREDVNTLVFSGNEFLNEKALAERYGVSKAPVRAALHRLCMENILISYPRKGYLIVTLTDAQFQQAQQLRVLNECYALELLSAGANRESFLELRELAAQGEGAKGNMDFHLALGRLTNNRFVEDVIRNLLCAVTRTLSIHLFGQSITSFRTAHLAVVDSLLDGNLEAAKQYLTVDILQP